MSQAVVSENSVSSLTGLLMPLADRILLLPNVAVAELIPYRAPQVSEGMPDWFLGQIAWRDLRLPLLSFEAASGAQAQLGKLQETVAVDVLHRHQRRIQLAPAADPLRQTAEAGA